MRNPLTDRLLEKAKHLNPSPYITLTAIHPTNRAKAVPSRHILATDIDQFNIAYARLMEANQQGWGAYMGIGYRKRQLSRYQRGGKRDILALPALFADIDRSPHLVLPQLKQQILEPSLVISSGRGVHLYWILTTPTGDIQGAGRILKGLARWLDADKSMSVDQVLRLPLSQNTKPLRQGAICSVLMESDCEYELDDFLPYEILMTPLQAKPQKSLPRPKRQHLLQPRSTQNLNPDLTQAVLNELQQTYGALLKDKGWYACYCPFAHTEDRYPGDHAYYHPDKGLLNCFGRHGQHLIHSIATQINLDVNLYGGIYTTDNL